MATIVTRVNTYPVAPQPIRSGKERNGQPSQVLPYIYMLFTLAGDTHKPPLSALSAGAVSQGHR